MRRHFLVAVVLFGLAASTLAASQVIERVVATVNGHPILQSDWDEEVRYEAFVNQKPLTPMTAAVRRSALDRLIDQELLREQMKTSDLDHPSTDEVKKQIEEIRKQRPNAQNEAVWKGNLRNYDLTEADLARHVAMQRDLTHLIEERLRPNVRVDLQSVEVYYREKLLPQLRQSGVKELPLEEASPKIRQVLAEQRLGELVTSWLRDLRGQSQIRMSASPPEDGVAVR